jgi:hypothetical protein
MLWLPVLIELELKTELLQVVDGQFVQVGDDFLGDGQLLSTV